MAAIIQAVSDSGGAAVVRPLHPSGSLAQVRISSDAAPGIVTTLGTASAAASPTYESIALPHAFSSSSDSGLGAAQRQALARLLGIEAGTGRTALGAAIDALLVPDATQSEVDVMVNDARGNPAAQTLYNGQGRAEIVGASVSGASAAVLAATERAPPGTAGTVPASPTAAPATVPVIRFDNAASMLQSLLAEAAAHAWLQANPAIATYSVGGFLFQMGAGAGQAAGAARRNVPGIRNPLQPVQAVARVRGVAEQDT